MAKIYISSLLFLVRYSLRMKTLEIKLCPTQHNKIWIAFETISIEIIFFPELLSNFGNKGGPLVEKM